MLADTMYAAVWHANEARDGSRVDDRATAYLPFRHTHISQFGSHAVECPFDIDSEHCMVICRVVVSNGSKVAGDTCEVDRAYELSL